MLINFGRYLYELNHIKAGNDIKAELDIGELKWQTATVRSYAGEYVALTEARLNGLEMVGLVLQPTLYPQSSKAAMQAGAENLAGVVDLTFGP
ncbi:hypothetical protein Tco_0740254 [Tanacetum coccineum]